MDLNTFKQNKLGILRLYKIVYQDNEDLNAKIKWIENNQHKKHYWQLWLPLDKLKKMGKTMYNPNTEEIADWMIKFRVVKATEKRVCYNPRAFCWASGQSLFLKPATLVYCEITGPGEPLREKFYFSPKHYTAWLLKH